MLRFGKPMPYKFNEGRRHKFPKARYRVTNWPDYDAALARRGELTVWLTDEAIAAWHAPATGERGGQPIYSAIAIETALTLRLVFHQPLRQTEGLLRSIAALLDIEIAIPDHTTLSRRGGGLTVLPKSLRRTAASPHRQHWSEDLRRGRVAGSEAWHSFPSALAQTASRRRCRHA